MNAHINYDLGRVAYEQGYGQLQWTTDYYRVNDLMHMVDDNITLALYLSFFFFLSFSWFFLVFLL